MTKKCKNNILENMTNCFKIKKQWFLIIGLLLLSNYYCLGQSFLSLPDILPKPNGRPFIVKLNPTSSIAEKCTSQTITLDIGSLMYLPGSNGPLPAGILITPVTSNGKTILTISGILNDGKQGSSLLMDIAMQFKPGTCDGVKQVIGAVTTNVGCDVISEQAGSVEVVAGTPNSANVLIYNYSTAPYPYCPRKILKYTLYVGNNGNSGFNLSNVKLNIELDKCVQVLDIYKSGTYESVNPVVTSGSDKVTASVNVSDLPLSVYTNYKTYDVYFMYPCLNNTASDCTSGSKSVNAYLTGDKTDCGLSFTTDIQRSYHDVSTSNQTCGDVSCLTGGTGGEAGTIQKINYGFSFKCPNVCLGSSMYAYFGFNTPPLMPNYANRKILIDVPQGINVFTSYVFSGATQCGTQYQVTYIDSQGNRQSTPFAGSLTRKIELTTDCTISSPSTSFLVGFEYNVESPPLPGTYLPFHYTYSSNGTVLLDDTIGSTIESCAPQLTLTKQVRKATQAVYENNYNASGVPGEIMTYRQEIVNYGIGDTNNLVTDQLDSNLEYVGGFRYAFVDYLYNASYFSYLEGEKSFTLPELGKVTVTVPPIGQSGTVSLSGFNFPCSPKRLYIEYNVRIKNNVSAGFRIPNLAKISGSAQYYGQPQANYITIAAFTYVKSKMFVKCSMASEWNESNINVRNGEVVDFKMQFSNAGSTPIVLSELVNLRPQTNDLFEFGSNSRKSTLDINYNCDDPTIFTNSSTKPAVTFAYSLNSPAMSRNMLCPPQQSGETPIWGSSCSNANWLKATFSNFTLLPGEYVDVVYKGQVAGANGTAFNSFAFKVGNCNIVSANSNTLAVKNDNNIGLGCNSCTLSNAYSVDMKILFENLMRNLLTRKINNETDASINGSYPAELMMLRPYLTNGGGEKIYNFTSTRNAQNKITSIRFSFSANSENDVTFLEEKGMDYNPEVGAIDPSYLRIDPTLYSSSDQYLTTCRRTFDNNGNVIAECNSKTQVRHIEFCPTRFCYPMTGDIKAGE
jgi:hypothetical protein